MRLTTAITATIGMMVAATLALYVLKLAAWAPVAAWPWWAIYSPLWVPWVLVAAAAALLLIGVGGDRLMRKLEPTERHFKAGSHARKYN